eukprot:scaffold1959_cov243-Pinguiococcus_pyrenoidosus.AAC.11
MFTLLGAEYVRYARAEKAKILERQERLRNVDVQKNRVLAAARATRARREATQQSLAEERCVATFPSLFYP